MEKERRQSGLKWHQRMLNKTEEEHRLIDTVMAVLDKVAEEDRIKLKGSQA